MFLEYRVLVSLSTLVKLPNSKGGTAPGMTFTDRKVTVLSDIAPVSTAKLLQDQAGGVFGEKNH